MMVTLSEVRFLPERRVFGKQRAFFVNPLSFGLEILR
jgi:hypothetical protein